MNACKCEARFTCGACLQRAAARAVAPAERARRIERLECHAREYRACAERHAAEAQRHETLAERFREDCAAFEREAAALRGVGVAQ